VICAVVGFCLLLGLGAFLFLSACCLRCW
jgi:hypothetical protein